MVNVDAEYIGTQLFSILILAGWSVPQVESITDSDGLTIEVALTVQRLCRKFREFDMINSLAA